MGLSAKKFILTMGGVIAWAINIIVIRLLFQTSTLNIYSVVLWTTILALPYWLLILFKKRGDIAKVSSKDYLLLLAIGIVNGVFVAIIEILALRYTTAINYAFLIRFVTLFTIIFSAFILKEKITRSKVILIILIFAGAYLLTVQNNKLNLTVGDIFTLVEAALLALGNMVLVKIASQRMDPTFSAAGSFVAGALPVLLISIWQGVQWSHQSWFLIILITITYILIRQLRFLALQLASTAYVTMLFSITPFFVIILAVPALGESMSPIQITGGSLIVIACMLVTVLKI